MGALMASFFVSASTEIIFLPNMVSYKHRITEYTERGSGQRCGLRKKMRKRETMEIGRPFEEIAGKDILDAIETAIGDILRDVGKSGQEIDFDDKDAIDVCLRIVGRKRLAEIKSMIEAVIHKVTQADGRQELDLYDEDAINTYSKMCALYGQMEEHGL